MTAFPTLWVISQDNLHVFSEKTTHSYEEILTYKPNSIISLCLFMSHSSCSTKVLCSVYHSCHSRLVRDGL